MERSSRSQQHAHTGVFLHLLLNSMCPQDPYDYCGVFCVRYWSPTGSFVEALAENIADMKPTAPISVAKVIKYANLAVLLYASKAAVRERFEDVLAEAGVEHLSAISFEDVQDEIRKRFTSGLEGSRENKVFVLVVALGEEAVQKDVLLQQCRSCSAPYLCCKPNDVIHSLDQEFLKELQHEYVS